MQALVGYTGFVGQNLYAAGSFDALYNSRNIGEAFGTNPDILFFCGIGAQKFLANTDPAADMAVVQEAMDNIARIAPKKLVLISTVDVYDNPAGVDEDTHINQHALHPYGLHRLRLEQWAQQNFEDGKLLIVRLPGLYGQGLKKNFLYDLITVVPAMLSAEKIEMLDKDYLLGFYQDAGNGFYKKKDKGTPEKQAQLKAYFENKGFTALSFTDSRAVFQFYNLEYLYGHIQTALCEGIRLLNITAEPTAASVIYEYLYPGKDFINHLSKTPPYYDSRSKWAAELGGREGYLFDRDFVLEDIRRFVQKTQDAGGQV